MRNSEKNYNFATLKYYEHNYYYRNDWSDIIRTIVENKVINLYIKSIYSTDKLLRYDYRRDKEQD